MNWTTNPVRILERVFQISGDERDAYFRQTAADGMLSEFPVDTLAGLVKEEDVCLDIGANLGLTTLLLATLAPRGQVYAFEPNPTTFEMLKRNITQNGATQVSCHNLALSSASGSLRFWSNEKALACSFAIRAEDSATAEVFSDFITVPAISVDDFVAQVGLNRLDFIKIDVEGFELDVLAGCADVLRRFRPTIFVEFNSNTLIRFADVSPRTALSQIRALCPEAYLVDRKTGLLLPILTDRDQDTVLSCNLMGGLVDNLVCSYPEQGVARRVAQAVARRSSRTVAQRLSRALRRVRRMLGKLTRPAA
jgi:FkbM family methyltransferase